MDSMGIEKLGGLKLKGGVRVSFDIRPLEGDEYHFSLTLDVQELDISTYQKRVTISLREDTEE